MKRITIIAAALATAALATTYIQTSSTGVAPWKPVKDSVSRAHLADSALKADSAKVSGISDSAKALANYIPLTGSDNITGDLISYYNNLGSSHYPWNAVYGVNFYGTFSGTLTAPRIVMNGNISGSGYDTVSMFLFDAGKGYSVVNGTAKGYLKADGSVDSSGTFTGNAATATKLATARTIGMSGDVTGTATAFDGTANITIPTTLPMLLTAGSAGSATSVPTLTWDAKGRLTSVGSATISIPHTQISDWGTYINQPLLTTSSPTFASATIANGVYRTYANDATVAAIYGSAVTPSGTNYALAWNQNGNGAYLNGTISSNLFVNNSPVLSATATGITAYQPISANGGITANSYSITALNAAPASASSTGTVGQIRWTDGYVYLCVSTNTWKRAALTTW